MMDAFSLSNTPLLHLGKGKVSLLPGIVKKYGPKAVLVTGNKSYDNAPWAARLQENFRATGIETRRVIIDREPSPLMVDDAVKQVQDFSANVVVAIGGGSVLDAGKAIAAMVGVDDSVKSYLEVVGTKQHDGKKLPFIAVPTTAGTGSEATKNAVLSQTGANGFKRSLRHDNFVPDIAIIDPELAISCPPSVTAASGMDAFTQLLESFLSTKANALTDMMALEGLRLVAQSLRKAFFHGDDVAARTDMGLAAYLSGVCLANAGLGTVHGFASSVGGLYPIPHGVVCSAMMYSSNFITVQRLRKNESAEALAKYAVVAKLFVQSDYSSEHALIDAFLEEIRILKDDLNIPTLRSYNVSPNDFDRIVADTDNKNNPVKLSKDELLEVLMMAM